MGSTDESKDDNERNNRELIELLNELRVALPGVQVLFAFLLTLPFTSGFGKLSELDRIVYFSAFMCTAVASVLLMTPTAQHRIRWRKGEKEILLRISNRLAITGMVFLGLAIGQVVFLIGEILFGLAVGLAMLAFIGILGTALWFVIPLLRTVGDAGVDATDGGG